MALNKIENLDIPESRRSPMVELDFRDDVNDIEVEAIEMHFINSKVCYSS